MFGNKKYLTLIIILFSFSNILCAGDRIPAKDFRFGLNIEGGIKFIGPSGFHGRSGFILKFNEKFSLIPYIGVYPDEYTETDTYYGGGYYNNEEYTNDEEVVDAGITLRFEYPREIIKRSTSYEYDIDEQKFLHHHYYSPFRLFWQLHLGSFMGAGGGFLYYLNGAVSIGLNIDVGYNLAAEEGFGISPKVVIATSF